MLAAVASGQAQGMGGRGSGDDRHHDGDHDDRDGHRRSPFFRGPFVYGSPYPHYASPTPGYRYYWRRRGA